MSFILVSDCKSKWKNLRDTYIKYANLVTKKRKKYIYADEMSFLLSSIKISRYEKYSFLLKAPCKEHI